MAGGRAKIKAKESGMSSAGVEFIDVQKAYGEGKSASLAVKGISFVIPTGTLATILGPSGCGKTTTLRMIAGLEQPTAGVIKIAGQDVTLAAPGQRNVSLVFQSYALFPHMSVLDNVAYGLLNSGMSKTDAHQRSEQVLESVGLKGLSHRWPSELSGGQQQRVAVARAVVIEPAVLLFDEPLSNLDARLRRQMRDEIRSIQQRLKLTVAYVTHDQSEALAVSDNIIVMRDGYVAQMGSPHELYERPANEFVAGFMGEASLFPAEVKTIGEIQLGAYIFTSKRAVQTGKVKLAIRPEAWHMSLPGMHAATCDRASLLAKVVRSVYLGSLYEYTVSSELGELFLVNHDVTAPFSPGQEVQLRLAEHGVSVIFE
jgi:iron(III) transport system ATP-binding protein